MKREAWRQSMAMRFHPLLPGDGDNQSSRNELVGPVDHAEPIVGGRRDQRTKCWFGTPPQPAGRRCQECDGLLSRWNRQQVCASCQSVLRSLE